MASRWEPFLKELFANVNDAPHPPSSVAALVSDPEALVATARGATGDQRHFLPNIASNWIHQYGVLPTWFLEATASHYRTLAELDVACFVQSWLTQFIALLVKCPPGLEDVAELPRWVGLGSQIIAEIERIVQP
jgi:hypothetical protein